VTKEQTFAVWAPREAIWSQWVKPVLFSQMFHGGAVPDVVESCMRPDWAPPADGMTAIVIDLPNTIVVHTALALAAAGYRPIPLFNAAPGSEPERRDGLPVTIVDVRPILSSIFAFTGALSDMRLPLNAPPSFMLDADRRNGIRSPSPGRFDNRSVSFPTDFPSSNLLLHHGVRQALLVQESGLQPQPDLAHTLRRWQDAGIQIFVKELSTAEGPHDVVVKKPHFYRAIWHRLFALIGLRRNPLGGFGGMLKQPSSG